MARYIDADKLIADILDERCISKTENAHIALKHFERMVNRLPTADVVPKSEVAREIFEELDRDLGGTIKRFPFCNRRYAELKKKYTEGEDEQRVGV